MPGPRQRRYLALTRRFRRRCLHERMLEFTPCCKLQYHQMDIVMAMPARWSRGVLDAFITPLTVDGFLGDVCAARTLATIVDDRRVPTGLIYPTI
jgi:hypothetical protein